MQSAAARGDVSLTTPYRQRFWLAKLDLALTTSLKNLIPVAYFFRSDYWRLFTVHCDLSKFAVACAK